MLFTTVAAFLFPVAIMAAPPAVRLAAGDENCLPTTYILSEYTSERSSSQNYVSFNMESTYTVDSPRVDPVEAGINCEADGAVIGDNNECNIRGEKTRKVVFDSYQREDSDIPSYRITHTWQCNNATWVSTNDVELPSKGMTCGPGKDSDTTVCNAKPVIVNPQNAQKLPADDSKKVKVDAKPAVKPSAKPTL